uniref:Uncharacterized protein n=1 Tax=Mus musculus TaxID=10090 RepID=Q8BT41_MOUSE|nr:unnamed protein product [Mus musculus]
MPLPVRSPPSEATPITFHLNQANISISFLFFLILCFSSVVKSPHTSILNTIHSNKVAYNLNSMPLTIFSLHGCLNSSVMELFLHSSELSFYKK